jgi:hypothetical protein
MPFGYTQTQCTRTANEASEPINKLLKGTKSNELALKEVGGYPCQSKSALINDELSDIDGLFLSSRITINEIKDLALDYPTDSRRHVTFPS